ncbi:DEAD/DEAH box helicase [Geminisphaera colitermitum]|uniref:helicase-related protein n=1 Tax=Geminisphaera colitermitum TaxID=1148786 RepID=UPI000158C709|nr:DEAD/DEAH box helicase [Geminisphaera colitermitum]
MITTIENDTLSLLFGSPWPLEDHAHFVRSKALPEAEIKYDESADTYEVRAPARFAPLMGMEMPVPCRSPLPLPDFLFDYQAWITRMAVEAKRFAVWADCGLGKTPIQLEWARQVHHLTGGRVLIMAPRAVIPQTIEETEKFYPQLPLTCPDIRLSRITTREDLAVWCKEGPEPFAIVNPEKMIDGVLPEMRWLSGIALDESSLLKTGGGVIKWNLIKSCRGIEYKLSLTATPAPNDTMEYASQAAFLEKLRHEGEILWTYFAKDKRGVWKVKPHARDAFYRFMSSWSIYLRKPGAYGFHDPFSDVPEPEIVEHRIEPTAEQLAARDQVRGVREEGDLLPRERIGVAQRGKLSQIAKGFRYEGGESSRKVTPIKSLKPTVVGALVRKAAAEGRQVLVWCVFDEEAKIVGRHLKGVKGVAQLHGDTPEGKRERILEDFRHGKIRVLVGKAGMLGYGLNFPFVETMVFSGYDDSFERFYQAVRRAYRYGATKRLTVHLPYIPGLEDHIWENILRKKSQWEEDTAACERAYAAAFSCIQNNTTKS